MRKDLRVLVLKFKELYNNSLGGRVFLYSEMIKSVSESLHHRHADVVQTNNLLFRRIHV